VQRCSDYVRLMQGVYENFLNMRFRDSQLEAVRYRRGTTLCAQFKSVPSDYIQ
jgi:hypothetical protein